MTRVLILEPDMQLGRLYAEALQARDKMTVAVAATAQDAIIEADKAKPDVVLLELQLTAHSGIEFLYEFRSYSDWAKVPVIVMSNVPPAEFAQSYKLLHQRLGVVAYHYKPRTNLQTIVHAVGNALDVLDTA